MNPAPPDPRPVPPGLAYSRHAVERMASRGIDRAVVELVLARGECRADPHGKGAEVFVVTTPVAVATPGLQSHGGMRVVLADRHRVVTVMWSICQSKVGRQSKLHGSGIDRRRTARHLWQAHKYRGRDKAG